MNINKLIGSYFIKIFFSLLLIYILSILSIGFYKAANAIIPADKALIDYILSINSILILSALYVIEFFPILLFMALYLLGLKVAKENIISFLILNGRNGKRIIFNYCFLITFTITILFSSLSGFIYPKIFSNHIKSIHKTIINNIISESDKLIEKKQFYRFGSYLIEIENIDTSYNENNKYHQISRATIFGFDKYYLNKITILNNLSYDTVKNSNINIENSAFANIYRHRLNKIITMKTETKDNLSINKEKLYKIYKKNYAEEVLLDKLPFMIQKHLYTLPKIYDYLFNKKCKGGLIEFIDRICYFLAFIMYSLLGYTLAINIRKRDNNVISYIVLFAVGFLIPFISIYLNLLTSKKISIYSITYLIPIAASIIIYIILKIKVKVWKS